MKHLRRHAADPSPDLPALAPGAASASPRSSLRKGDLSEATKLLARSTAKMRPRGVKTTCSSAADPQTSEVPPSGH